MADENDRALLDDLPNWDTQVAVLAATVSWAGFVRLQVKNDRSSFRAVR